MLFGTSSHPVVSLIFPRQLLLLLLLLMVMVMVMGQLSGYYSIEFGLLTCGEQLQCLALLYETTLHRTIRYHQPIPPINIDPVSLVENNAMSEINHLYRHYAGGIVYDLMNLISTDIYNRSWVYLIRQPVIDGSIYIIGDIIDSTMFPSNEDY